MIVDFKPWARKDGRFAIEITVDGNTRGFLHWIDAQTNRICKSSTGEICKSFHCEDEAQGICEWLKEAYEKGEIK